MRKILITLAVLAILVGIGILAYPTVCKWLNGQEQSAVIADYTQAASADDTMQEELERARRHNDNLWDAVALVDPFSQASIIDSSDYRDLLDFTAEGVMGYVEIPSIDVLLPIYHGVGSDVLAKGVGHIPETSLPVGGDSTHAVLVAHSGMTNARLFTDLPKLELGDVFYIHTCNETLTYTVDQSKQVYPSDTSALQIVEGQDYVTLVTCVPITVNTYRLLVRGKRV